MLGLGDWGVSLAYVLTLGSAALCAAYGFVNWNRPAPEEEAREKAAAGARAYLDFALDLLDRACDEEAGSAI